VLEWCEWGFSKKSKQNRPAASSIQAPYRDASTAGSMAGKSVPSGFLPLNSLVLRSIGTAHLFRSQHSVLCKWLHVSFPLTIPLSTLRPPTATTFDPPSTAHRPTAHRPTAHPHLPPLPAQAAHVHAVPAVLRRGLLARRADGGTFEVPLPWPWPLPPLAVALARALALPLLLPLPLPLPLPLQLPLPAEECPDCSPTTTLSPHTLPP
jgi:hypothetical protein